MDKKYTNEDREAFQRKDRQQAKGFAVTQAIEILSKGLKVNEVLEIAGKISDYTAKELLSKPAATGSSAKPAKKSSDISAKAQEVLDALVKEYSKFGEVDVDKLKTEILKMKEGGGRFPTSLKSVPIVLKTIKPELVVKGVKNE